jgi:hypothetical protein
MKATLLFSIATAVLGTSALLHAADTSAASKRIDDLLVKGLAKHKLTPNAPVDEATFLRRTYLTVIGRIPTQEEAKQFLDSKDSAKRSKLIDSLLNSEGYVHHAFDYWADVLRAQSQGVGDSTTSQNYLNYLRQSLRENKPWAVPALKMVPSATTCGIAACRWTTSPTPRESSSAPEWSALSATTILSTNGRRSSSTRWPPSRTT